MHLYLMRHAEAAPLGGAITTDVQRPLTAHGHRQIYAALAELQRRGAQIDRIITSPLRRTVQTAEAVAQAFGISQIERADLLIPSGQVPDIRPFLDSELAHRGALIVAHHPDVALLANSMGAPDIAFRPAAIAFFERDAERRELRYRYLITPDELL